MRGTAKLLVVRHPFERVLSAYRDKLENSVAGREHGTLYFYEKYGSKIVRKYRDKNFIPPRDDQVVRRQGAPPPAGIEPTFREFVEYLIDTNLASYGDDHWMPYYLFCTPCSLKYDIVAKVTNNCEPVTSKFFTIVRNLFYSLFHNFHRHLRLRKSRTIDFPDP